jgi:ParB family chromosome partitioning protein
MAMGKNKTGIMAAISAATEVAASQTEPRDRAQRTLPRGTIGSVRAGLGGIQEIDPALILAWGPQDRLGVELTAVNSAEVGELAESIGASGQQVPVLLRPSKEKDGHFEVIYGRRRILACRQLGIPVKALIRTLDDAEALMAKGLENASRTDLSYYERARFAQAILEQGYSRSEVCQALAVSKATLSQLERITRLVPDPVGDRIGAAPAAGRPKWMSLATAFEGGRLDDAKALKILAALGEGGTSDERLEAVLSEVARRGARDRAQQERSPVAGVQIKTSRSSVTMSVAKSGAQKEFAEWLDQNLDGLIAESFERFQAENRGGEGG